MFFCFFISLRGGSSFAVFFALFLKEGILNDIAHDSIILDFTVLAIHGGLGPEA